MFRSPRRDVVREKCVVLVIFLPMTIKGKKAGNHEPDELQTNEMRNQKIKLQAINHQKDTFSRFSCYFYFAF